MRNIINSSYKPDLRDTRRSVNKLEYEVRDAATKADIAELFLKVKELEDALEKNEIEIEAMPAVEREEFIANLVKEDKEERMQDVFESIHQMRLEALAERTGPLGVLKNWAERKLLRHSTLSNEVKVYIEEEDQEYGNLFAELKESL